MDQNIQKVLLQEILVAPEKVLTTVAQRVASVSIKEQELLDKMNDLMTKADGIGLAAPQIGISTRVIVMDVPELESYKDNDITTQKFGKFEMINPVITSREGKARWMEGCLSIPGINESIERDLVIDVSYLDRFGNEKKLKASGLLSACIQHEVDHLDGKLFVDRLSLLKRDMIINKLKKFKKKGRMLFKQASGLSF